MAWLGTWKYRYPLKYGTTKPSNGLTSYPVLFSINDSILSSESTAGGGGRPSMAVTKADGTTTTSFGSLSFSSSTLLSRAKFDVSSSANTGDVLGYLYVDHTQTDQESKSGVLDGSTTAYWTFDDSPTGSAGDIFDWSGNHNGTSHNSITSVSAIVNKGLQLTSASSQWIDIDHDIISYGTAYTFRCWFNTSSPGAFYGHVGTNVTPGVGSPSGWVPCLYVDTSGNLRGSPWWFNSVSNQVVSSGTVNDGNWHHVALTTTGTPGGGNSRVKLYLDGSLNADSVSSFNATTYSTNYYFFLASNYWNSWPVTSGSWSFFNGKIDEVFMDSIDRPVEWLNYQYNNENNNSSTITIGSVESLLVPQRIQKPFRVSGKLLKAFRGRF